MDYFWNAFNPKNIKPMNFISTGNDIFITDCKSQTVNSRHIVSMKNEEGRITFNMVGGDKIVFTEETNKDAYNTILKNLF